MTAPELLSSFLTRPALLFFDFDGTLSNIVEKADQARPLQGAPKMLASLARRHQVVIVSGRSAHQLLQWLGPEVEIWGTHGAERTENGEVVLTDAVAPYVDEMAKVFQEAVSSIEESREPGIYAEDKRVITTIHYRPAPDHRHARAFVEDLVRSLAAKHDVTYSSSRSAFEIKPPVELSKRQVVVERTRTSDLRAALYVGDDTVDLSAFDALDEVEREGVSTLRVAVDSEEAPAELLRRADVVLGSPQEVLDTFSSLG